ncbi:hypothetical protein BGZ97_008604 [Linnemannia gamsii]|uniref:Uncharacterized protein n=1 Tax=Linnemannia gamsii TaxID=64522 RepID=A0A9P6QLR1_9FUNG|nr:hypothetical protein BGZ97_008604 [Linnemannia gamsii]
MSGADPKVIVTAYLSNNRVVSKNKDAEQFTNALSVFVDRQQSKVVDDGTPSSSQVRYESLRARFKDVCAKHKESKKSQAQKTHSSAYQCDIGCGACRSRRSCSFNKDKNTAPSSKYSFKTPTGVGPHWPPSKAMQFKWKPPKTTPAVTASADKESTRRLPTKSCGQEGYQGQGDSKGRISQLVKDRQTGPCEGVELAPSYIVARGGPTWDQH